MTTGFPLRHDHGPRHAWGPWLIGGLLLLPAVQAGAAGATLDGAWQQTRLRQTYRLSPSWNSEFCPPRPQDQASSRPLTFQGSGSPERYLFRSGRESFGSHDCLSPNPAVTVLGYDLASRTTRCATPDSVGTREEEHHRLVLQGETVAELEGQYHYFWVLQGATCEAWMIEHRRLERSAAPVGSGPTTTLPTMPPLAVVPTEPATPVVEPSPRPSPVATTAGASPRRGPTGARIELILGPDGEPRPATAETGNASALRRSGTLEQHTRPGPLLLVGLGLLLLAGGVGAAVWSSRRATRRRPRAAPPRPEIPQEVEVFSLGPDEPRPTARAASTTATARVTCPRCGQQLPADARFCPFDATALDGARAANSPPPASAAPRAATDTPAPALLLVCPECQQEYAPGRETCPRDGALLLAVIPLREGASRRRATRGVYKACPRCEARYSPEISFCGKDGTPLVVRRDGDGPSASER